MGWINVTPTISSSTCTHAHLDLILTYQDDVKEKKKGDEDTDEKREKRVAKRQKFLESCVELGLEYELQDCRVTELHFLNALGHYIRAKK